MNTKPLAPQSPMVMLTCTTVFMCSVLGVEPVLAHPPFGISASLTVEWSATNPCHLTLTVQGFRINYPEPVESQKILVEVEDSIGTRIGKAPIVQVYPDETPESGESIFETADYLVEDDSGVHQVRLSWWDNGTGGEPTGFVIQKIPDYCPDTLISCGNCGGQPEPLAFSTVRVYKSAHVVYALHPDDESGATYGETVSGRFKAPSCGILQVEVTGANSNAQVRLSGWNGDGALAEAGTTYTQVLDKDELYKFNIRAVRGDQRSVTITFDWYVWKNSKPPGNKEDCLMHYEYKTGGTSGLIFSVPALRYTLKPLPEGAPLILAGKKHIEPTLPSALWYEIERPCCGPAGENVTEMFVLPDSGDGKISDGHALKWRKNGTYLIAPDPDGLRYEIEGF